MIAILDSGGRTSMLGLEGKTGIVTGGSSGIGAAIVAELARQGARVLSVDINRGSAEGAEPVRDAVTSFQGNVTEHADVEAFFAEAVRSFGRVDALVNVAGGSLVRLVKDMTEDEWDRMLDLNLKSVFLCCRTAVPLMLAQRSGRIVNISSNMAVTGGIGRAHYSAAKAGVIGLTKSLALELGSVGITANVVAPGPTDTARIRAMTSADERAALARSIPLGRAGQPADVASLVAFLISDAAAYVTGQTIHVNGGFVMP